jgi:tetratricopeptide (TPR) repeat protein
VLDEAMSERVITDVPGAPGRLRFGHALIRDTLYDELSSGRKLRLHRAAAEALEKVYSADLEPHLAELAHHYFTAVPDGEPGKALEYARRAGDRAASQLAYEEAVRLYEMALTLVGEDAARCELLLALGDAQARAGDMPAAQRAFRTAADLAEQLGLREQLARGALGYGGRLVWEVSRGDVHHVPLLERALAAIGDEDSALRVKLLARLAGGPLRDATFPPERRLRLSNEALDMARRIGDPGTLAYALAGYNAANHRPDFTPEQGTLATELIGLATEAGEPELLVEGLEHRATAQLELGDMQGAKADIAAMARMADEIRQPSQDWIVLVYRALLALLEGDFAEAEARIADEPGLGGRAQSWNAAVTYGLQLYVLRREQGRLDEIEELVRYSVETYPTYPIWRCVLAQTAAQLGHPTEADRAVEALVDMPLDEEWLVGIGLLAEAASTLGDADRSALVYDRLRPYGDRVAVSYPEISTGSVSRNLGLLAATMERWDAAERHFEEALEMNSRIGARPWLAHAQEDYARMLLARDDPGDRERSRELMQAAELAYGELGIPPTGLSGGTAPSSP